ncbi:MAG: type II toxin-antitoxin system VapC family toxin [Sphingomonadaceae bacterium]|nr:type II toxin-antitoxin system VapC family toxin [Sphingomonadaceae bacterium]
MDYLIDTHAMIWAGAGYRQLSPAAAEAIVDPTNRLLVSAVSAWEFEDLHRRGRLAGSVALDAILDALSLVLVDLPAHVWRVARRLPNLHGDPVDRMLIAHAIHADLTLITADKMIRRYPVRTLW